MEVDERGRVYGDICIRIADSVCYTAETNIPLQSNYTPIKKLKKIKNKTVMRIHGTLGLMKFKSFLLCGLPKRRADLKQLFIVCWKMEDMLKI